MPPPTTPRDVSAETPFAARLAWHLGDLMRLAWPVMLSRAGILVMAFADIAMLGRYAPGAVGIANLGLAVFIPMLVMAIGLCTGLVAVVARAHGAGDMREAGHAWCRAMVWGGVISLLAAWVVWHSETILSAFGQEPRLAAEGGAVARALAPGLCAQVVFAISAFYLEGTRRPHFALGVMVGANLINAFLNWVLIWGHLGMPELGPVGAAWASTAARVAAAGAMVGFILLQRHAHARGVRGPWDTVWGPGGWRAGATMRKLGLSAGIGNGLETMGFAAMTFLAGQISLAALDAYSISHNLVSMLFMVGLGLSIATGVRVGHEVGRGRLAEAAFAGWAGFGATVAVMGTLGLAVWFWRHEIAPVYTDDPALQARAAGLFVFSALVFVPDACQVVLGQAVRALGDAWVAIAVYGLAFVVVLMPLGWAMVEIFGTDERGLVQAIILSCLVATVLLAARFRALTRGWRRT
ncbi:MATE family efflux transporter [Paralimibaculum aggregatum]|uniref:MATE family efflux transporter n=1 Tax=Paralimibaculum aggregatum TaxID=3036245 RepID=A0ABQ6LBX9_9RHOB|nr:MATE family efflux transporter [Limibaculum sp. NKW23]GMG80898.1 MATE family efflux transporter [Limibaculum sp. NKW23]